MSMGPLGGIVGSVAGSPLSQTKGASEERAARDSAAKETADELDLHAEKSAGIGQTEEEQGASDRDADGRRLWERTDDDRPGSDEEEADDRSPPPDGDGHRLDLTA